MKKKKKKNGVFNTVKNFGVLHRGTESGSLAPVLHLVSMNSTLNNIFWQHGCRHKTHEEWQRHNHDSVQGFTTYFSRNSKWLV